MRFLHISTDGSLPAVLSPRVPAGSPGVPVGAGAYQNPDKAAGKFSEPPVPRICVGPDIERCFAAIYPNFSRFFEEDGIVDMQFHVYEIKPYPNAAIVTPDELVRDRRVMDAHVTQEHWILGKVQSYYLGSVMITPDLRSDYITFHPYNDTKIARLELSPSVLKIGQSNDKSTKPLPRALLGKRTDDSRSHQSVRS